MSWSFRIEQRSRIALALGAAFFLITLAYWFVSFTMSQVNSQFKSVYYDRLIPALDMAAIQERYYQNRLLIEEQVLSLEEKKIEAEWQTNNAAIDSILIKFKATQLTAQEKLDLQQLILAGNKLRHVQEDIMVLQAAGKTEEARNLYKTEAQVAFLNLLKPLHALSSLQQQVGLELYASAERQVKALHILAYLVIGLAVIIALLIATLLQTNRKMKQIKPQNFHLN